MHPVHPPEEAKAEDAAAEGDEPTPAGVPDYWMCAIRNALTGDEEEELVRLLGGGGAGGGANLLPHGG